MTKYIFITGGVASGIGKGILTASLGRLLIESNLKDINLVKLDPYLNVDPGTLNPVEHGEVYVTADGGEVDLDFGHYERFTGLQLSKESSITSGQVYAAVLKQERAGTMNGETCQVIPHVTNEIKRRLLDAGKNYKLVLVEIGGTVGDIEGVSFIEAIRQLGHELGPNNCYYAHLVWIPRLTTSGEIKTKPAQHSVKTLLSLGIRPDALFCRSDIPLDKASIDKLKNFCNTTTVINCPDIEPPQCIYHIPLVLYLQNVLKSIDTKLRLNLAEADLSKWYDYVGNIDKGEVSIAIVGKYNLPDAYLSVIEALQHAGWKFGKKVRIKLIINKDEALESYPWTLLDDIDGVVIPGGFGTRSIAGKISAAHYCLESRIPTLGICMGFQCMAIHHCRSHGLLGADSTELHPQTEHNVIDLLEGQSSKVTGGTLRLGSLKTGLDANSYVGELYKNSGDEDTKTIYIHERFRHRYGLNEKYRYMFDSEDSKFKVVGNTEDGRAAVIEYSDEFTKYNFMYVGTQFHPEFQSTPTDPHPLFIGLIKSAISYRQYKDINLCATYKTG